MFPWLPRPTLASGGEIFRVAPDSDCDPSVPSREATASERDGVLAMGKRASRRMGYSFTRCSGSGARVREPEFGCDVVRQPCSGDHSQGPRSRLMRFSSQLARRTLKRRSFGFSTRAPDIESDPHDITRMQIVEALRRALEGLVAANVAARLGIGSARARPTEGRCSWVACRERGSNPHGPKPTGF